MRCWQMSAAGSGSTKLKLSTSGPLFNQLHPNSGQASTSYHCQQEISTILYHLVGAGEQRRRNFEAESLGRLEIDDQFELRGKGDREVSRLRTFKYLVNVACALTGEFEVIRPI